MKRALLVTTGTAAGLVSVLSYSGHAAPAAAGGTVSGGAPAAPAAAATGAPGSRAHAGRKAGDASRTSAHRKTPSGAATHRKTDKRAAKPSAAPAPKATAKATGEATAGATAKPTTKPTSKPTSKPVSKPKPTPTPTQPAGPTDYLGPVAQSKYGPLQVGIRVANGTLVDVWAATYPTGESQPYSEMALPILRAQTLAAKSAQIAGATGASFTSAAWKTSLAGALAKARL